MQNHGNTWTEEIKSENSLWSVNYKEIWHYRDLLLMLVKRNFTNFYKQKDNMNSRNVGTNNNNNLKPLSKTNFQNSSWN